MTDQFDPLLDALENERRYVARELHDGVAQTALQLGLQAGICRKLLERGNLDMLTSELAQLEERVQLASSQVREMIQDMRPPTIEPDASLDDYIKHVLDIHLQRGGPPVAYDSNLSEQTINLSPRQALTLTRIIQEALLNIRKHAQAQQVRLTVSTEENNVMYLTIADDGQGFDPAEVEARPVDKGGAGLTNLHMRTRAIGGSLTVTRDATAQGTKITVILSQ